MHGPALEGHRRVPPRDKVIFGDFVSTDTSERAMLHLLGFSRACTTPHLWSTSLLDPGLNLHMEKEYHKATGILSKQWGLTPVTLALSERYQLLPSPSAVIHVIFKTSLLFCISPAICFITPEPVPTATSTEGGGCSPVIKGECCEHLGNEGRNATSTGP